MVFFLSISTLPSLSVFLVQPTALTVNLMALFPIPSLQTCQRFSTSPQTPDFLRSIFHFALLKNLELFERSEFLIDTSKKKICECVRLICACVRLILVLVGGRQTAIVVRTRYYVPDTYVPHFMIPGTYYVPDTYDTRYVLCTRCVCTTLAVVLLIVQLYRYLFIR